MDTRLRILVVDDMPAMRMIIRNMLLEMGFSQIEEADDGELAWQMLSASARDLEPYGLVVADWNMRAMSGVDLLRAIRSAPRTRKLPFLIVTGEGDREHLQEAFRAGVSDFIVKPFNAEQLRTKIEAALQGT